MSVLVGDRSGAQTAIALVGRNKSRNSVWLVRCVCGKERRCTDTGFKRSVSCGTCGPSLADRFWAKVSKSGPIPAHLPELGPCWVWTGAIFEANGYGAISINDSAHTAHRVSWDLHNGPIPQGNDYHGTCVLHRCDNRPCVRPTHLFLGTQAQNLEDMRAKGRDVNSLLRLKATQ